MLAVLRETGSDTLDTAISYGDSEVVLGRARIDGFRVVTKLPPLPVETADVAGWVRRHVRTSLDRLRVANLYGLLLHRPADVSGPHAGALLAALATLKAEGVVTKVGASVYAPEELAELEGAMKLDLVQAPYNVFDRRFESTETFRRLHAAGTEVHVRSVFLQGLLLLDEDELPETFRKWQPLWQRWCGWVRQQGTDQLAAALGFALANPTVDRIVVGAESAAQLRSIVASTRLDLQQVPVELATGDLNLINPTNWTAS